MHVNEGGVSRAPQDKVDKRDVVDHRIGVRHDDHGGDAARRRGAARARQRLAVLVTGLAGEDHHVDEARRERAASAFDDLRAATCGGRDVRP